MSEAMPARLQEQRAQTLHKIGDLERALDAARHWLDGFDAALEIVGAAPPGRAAETKPLALPAPGRKGRRKAARPKGRTAGGGQETDREKHLRALWSSDKPTPAIAQELGCSTANCYQLAKKLKLGKRPRSARAKRAKRAKKTATKPSADPAPAAAPKPPAASRTITVAERSNNARPAPRPSPAQRAGSALAPLPKPKLPPIRAEEDAQVAAFIAEKGVTRAADFGTHQAVVDAARSVGFDLLRLKTGYQQPAQWSLNGAAIRAAEVYRRVNAELARRGRPLVPMPQEEPAQ